MHAVSPCVSQFMRWLRFAFWPSAYMKYRKRSDDQVGLKPWNRIRQKATAPAYLTTRHAQP